MSLPKATAQLAAQLDKLESLTMPRAKDVNETLLWSLAFAIEDPMGADAIELARALIELGRATPEKHRKTVAGLCRAWVRSFGEGENEP